LLGYTEIINLLQSKGAKARQNVSVKPDLYVSLGHTAGILAMDVSPDGKYILSFGMDKNVILWEAKSGKEIKSFSGIDYFSDDEKNSFYKNSVKFSPDGKRFLISGEKVEEYSLLTGEKIRSFDAIGGSVYSYDGNYIITGGGLDDLAKPIPIKILDAKTGIILKEFYYGGYIVGDKAVKSTPQGVVSLTPDGKYFVANSGGYVLFYEIKTGKLYKSFKIGGVRSLDISSDGKFLLVSSGRYFSVYNIETDREIFSNTHPGSIACFSPDGKIIASGGHDQLVILWNAATGEKIKELFGHNHYISSLKFSPDGKHLYSASRDKTIIEWDVAKMIKQNVMGGKIWRSMRVSFTPDGKYLVTTGGYDDYSLKIWNLHKITEIKEFNGHKGNLFGFTFSPDSSTMLTFGEDRIPRLWDFTTGTRKMTFKTHNQVVLGAGFSPDGKYCFSYSNDKKVILWDVNSGKKVLVLNQVYLENSKNTIHYNQNPSTLFCFTPDSKYFITGDSTGTNAWTLYKFDVSTGKVVKTIALKSVSDQAKSAVIRNISVSPDGKYLVISVYYRSNNQNTTEIQLIDILSLTATSIVTYAGDQRLMFISDDNSRIISFDYNSRKVFLIDVSKKSVISTYNSTELSLQNNAISPDGKYFIAFKGGKITFFDLQSGKEIQSFDEGHLNISYAGFSPDGQFLVYSLSNFTIKIVDLKLNKVVLSLIQFGNNDWVASNPDGLFDASANAMNLLYYTSGLKVIELDQMKERYYEPNLLPKVLGFNKEKIRNVESLSEVGLFPDVNVGLSNTNLVIDLKNQGGGIGKVVILVNGKEIASDARGPKPDPDADKLKINFDLKNHPYLKPGKENIIEVKAYNEEGYLVSRGAALSYTPQTTAATKPPHLYIISSGVSDYTGDQIDLKYAAKDAEDVANALKIGGERLFGAENTHIYLMTSNNKDEGMQPTKANILRVFAEIAKKASSSDVFILYLSGHGINWGGQDGDFYYLTKDAYTANIDAYNDPKIRSSSTISSAELTDLFKKVPALKQVLMIDACASGKAVENLMAKRDISASTLRALDRMKDRVGMYIITGCAADAVSYEASKFGQGLLTYSLLEGIKGTALRDDYFIDIALLLTRAQERVPELAADIGGIQKPQVFSPYGSQSFDIGELNEDDKTKITLAQPKPMFLMSVFLEEESMDDILGLEKMVDDAFRNVAAKGQANLIFVQAKEFPEAYRIRGQYSVKGNEVEVKINIFRGKEKVGNFTIKGSTDKIDNLVNEIILKASEISK